MHGRDTGPEDATPGVDPRAPGTEAPPAGQGRPDLGTLCARASAVMDADPLQDLQTRLVDLHAAIAALTPTALDPRRGLAGVFDSRSGRLKRFRSAYRATAAATAEAADALSRGAGRLMERHETLSALWTDLRDAVVATEPAPAPLQRPVPAPPAAGLAGEPAEPAPPPASADRADEPISIRTVALASLAAMRAARNAEHRIPERLIAVRDGVLAWQAEWEDALGLRARRPRHRRPDIARLAITKATVLDTVALAQQALEAAMMRRSEIARRLPGRESWISCLPGPQGPVQEKDGTASQA